MNAGGKSGAAWAIGGIASLAFVGILFLVPFGEDLRACGHPQGFWHSLNRLTGFHREPRHCCTVLSMYNDMRACAGSQEMHRLEHSTYTASLHYVTNQLGRIAYRGYELTTNGQHWYVRVAAGEEFPGNYLFEGGPDKITTYFNRMRPATTNDMILHVL